MQEALADYEEARNQASKLNYEENLAAARFLPPPPQYFAIRSAVRHRPEQATRLIKASMGMIDPSSFFNHENLQQLLGAAVG